MGLTKSPCCGKYFAADAILDLYHPVVVQGLTLSHVHTNCACDMRLFCQRPAQSSNEMVYSCSSGRTTKNAYCRCDSSGERLTARGIKTVNTDLALPPAAPLMLRQMARRRNRPARSAGLQRLSVRHRVEERAARCRGW
ncbi:MAG: hypothetical protein QOG17_722 [Gammaproteobacteria bacterium]|jgi:hypothetical protein|nr:hypothetical protein [Gammaproteobacteria bacterium]